MVDPTTGETVTEQAEPTREATALALSAGVALAYPLDGYEETGITRLLHQRWIQEGEMQGKRRPSGELLPMEMVDLRMRERQDFQLPPADAQFDLDGDNDVDTDDYSEWLTNAATENGEASTYRGADTDLDRDVDITDFNNLATHFDPGGVNAATNGHSKGNSDGDNDVDITDFNNLATNFSPGGYDSAAATNPASKKKPYGLRPCRSTLAKPKYIFG